MYANNVTRIDKRDIALSDGKEILGKKDVLKNVLEECRMIIPGVQGLFGFQLIAVFNSKFYDLHVAEQSMHLAAMVLSIMAICFLMAPAAYHRIAERDSVSEQLIRYASKLLCFAMVPLAASLSIDIYIIFKLVTNNSLLSILVSSLIFCTLSVFWYAIPEIAKNRKRPLNEAM